VAFTLSQCEVEDAQEDDEEQDAEAHDIPVSLLCNETKNHKLRVFIQETLSAAPEAGFPKHNILISPALTLGHH